MWKWLIKSRLCAKQQTLLIPYKIIRVYSNEYTGSICVQNMIDSPFTRNLHMKKSDFIISYRKGLFSFTSLDRR